MSASEGSSEGNSTIKRKHPRDQFTQEEDLTLANLVIRYGEDNWEKISEYMPNRNVRQCRDRWLFYLSPSINTNEFTVEDDMKLIDLYIQYGSQWKTIAKRLREEC